MVTSVDACKRLDSKELTELLNFHVVSQNYVKAQIILCCEFVKRNENGEEDTTNEMNLTSRSVALSNRMSTKVFIRDAYREIRDRAEDIEVSKFFSSLLFPVSIKTFFIFS
jgi:hypothetical protein